MFFITHTNFGQNRRCSTLAPAPVWDASLLRSARHGIIYRVIRRLQKRRKCISIGVTLGAANFSCGGLRNLVDYRNRF